MIADLVVVIAIAMGSVRTPTANNVAVSLWNAQRSKPYVSVSLFFMRLAETLFSWNFSINSMW
jgi:hypothetical protein